MPGLPQSGVELIAQGVPAYLRDLTNAAKATDDFASGLGSAAGKGSAFGEIITGALRYIGTIAIDTMAQAAQAVGAFVKDSVTSAANVEQTLAVIGATSGATAAQLEQLRATAIALGGDLTLPATSAQDATDAMLELTKAGFSVDEAMAAAKGTLQLAAAAEIDAGAAARITAQAINAFGLAASDAAHIADLLAGGANASSASMTDLSQGLQQGGFAFDAAGQTIDDLVVSVAALTNVGLTGSDAGTALKNAMMRLMNPTDKAADLMQQLGIQAYDAQGSMKPWPELLQHIRAQTAGMTAEQRNAALGTIFLSDGMKAMLPLLDMSAADYAKLTAEVTKTGSAQTVADAQTQGFNGAIAGLQSQIETLQLIIGTKLLPLLTPLIQDVAAAASSVTTFAMALLDSGDPLAVISAQFPLLGDAIATVTAILPIAQGYVTALGDTFVLAFTGIQSVVSSVMPFILAVITAVGGQIFAFWSTNGDAIMTFVQTTWTTVREIVTVALDLVQATVQGVLATVLRFIADHGAEIQRVLTAAWTIISSVITAALAIITGVMIAALAIINGDWTTAWHALQTMSETVVNAIYAVITSVLELIATAMGTSLTEIGATWDSNFKKLGAAVAPYMQIAQDTVTTSIHVITDAFGEIAGAINTAISAVKDFINAASKIKVPSLITPGSPTPLELGMRGIAEATTVAATTFQAQLAPALTMVHAPASAAMGATTTSQQTTYNMPVYTNQSPAVVRQSFAVMEAMRQ